MLPKFLKTGSDRSVFLTGIKNTTFLSVGSILSQVIGFVGFIFIARLFGPENYGIYATVVAFVSFFYLFVLTGMAKAMVREGSKRIDSFSRILEETIGLRIFFIIIALILCLGATFFTNYSRPIKVFIIIFSCEIIYFGLNSFLGIIYQTTQKMQYLAYFSVLTRFLVTTASIIALYIGAGVLVILLVNLLSKFIVLALNYSVSRRLVVFRVAFGKVRFRPHILKPTFIFSLNKFLETFAVRIDLLMISFLSTSIDVGIYGVAHQITSEGIMIRNIVSVAFFPIAVKYLYEKKIRIKTLFSYAFVLFLAVLAGCFVVSFFIKDLIVLFFGTNYSDSGHILVFLIFSVAFAFYTIPLTTYLQATHNEHLLLLVPCVSAPTNITLNILFFYEFGLIGIAYSTLVVFFLQSVLISYLAWRKLRCQENPKEVRS